MLPVSVSGAGKAGVWLYSQVHSFSHSFNEHLRIPHYVSNGEGEYETGIQSWRPLKSHSCGAHIVIQPGYDPNQILVEVLDECLCMTERSLPPGKHGIRSLLIWAWRIVKLMTHGVKQGRYGWNLALLKCIYFNGNLFSALLKLNGFLTSYWHKRKSEQFTKQQILPWAKAHHVFRSSPLFPIRACAGFGNQTGALKQNNPSPAKE